MSSRLVVMATILLLTAVSVLPSQSAQAEGHPAGACSAAYHVSGAGWDFCWQQEDPRAQGLELNQVYFHGDSVMWKIGAPFSLTKYEPAGPGPYKDTLGNPGAGGHPGYGAGSLDVSDSCPRWYGGESTLLNGGKLCVEHRAGPEPAVTIWTRYNIYNYRFMQGYELDARGNIEPFIRMGGNLIDGNSGETGINHFHHLIWRADFDIGQPGGDVAEVYHRPPSTPAVGVNVDPFLLVSHAGCDVTGIVPGWTPIVTEKKDLYDLCTAKKWRVKAAGELNSAGRERSFEFKAVGDTSADTYSTMDVMVLQYKGDSTELGYEVPTNPISGDQPLMPYFTPAEPITDPVVWMFQHVYHDTRDEDRRTMTYHHAHADIHPRNFHGENMGERTYP